MNILDRLLPSRALLRKIHLYLALGAGFLVALMGLTGSLSVYREEIDRLLNPDLIIDAPQDSRYQSLDRIMTAVRRAHPDRDGVWTLEMPASPGGTITAWFDKPRESYFELYAPLMVSVNPYTAEVVASRFWGQTVVTWLLDWHTQFHSGRMGWNAVGLCGFLLILSAATGLVLWWPGIKALPSALRCRHGQGWMRFVFDLHRLLGFLSAPILLVLAATGFLLSYPSVLSALTDSKGMHHGDTGPALYSTAVPHDHPTGLEAATFIARGPFARAELRRVTTPAGETGIYRINLRQSDEINRRHPYTTVWVDRWSGHIREVRDPASFTRAQTIATAVWPVHTGEALGAYGRFLWFLSGLGLFFLYVTGLTRWLFRKGTIQDRPVDWSGVRRLTHEAGQKARTFRLFVWRGIILLAGKIRQSTPKVVSAAFELSIRIRQVLARLIHRQKRIGKID